MRRAVLFLVLFTLALSAANFRLYTKDGDYQNVSEYHVEGDHVRFYSVDRSDWEEVPLEIVDLKKTETENASKKAVLDKQAQEIDEENAAARAARAEIEKIPQDPGVYQLDDSGKLHIFHEAEIDIHNAKGRNILKALSPVPLIPGKATVEIAGEHSENVVTGDRPEFFFQLGRQESFGIIRLTSQKATSNKPPNDKGFRIVERVTVEPVIKTLEEERDSVEIFTKQLTTDSLYKIWPQDTLAKGEYAVIEYTQNESQTDVNMRVWDFRVE